jgi:Na+/H+ antiporter NhaD/arsenite permease-like protein
MSHLLVPTLINLGVAYLMLRFFYPDGFRGKGLSHVSEKLLDSRLASVSKASLALMLLLLAVKVAAVSFGVGPDFRLTYVALAGAAPILLLSPRRFEVLSRIDWQTLVFFASMFILMESVWESGYFQASIAAVGADITSTPMILAVSVVLSQLISNVPLVALYLPMLVHGGASEKGLLALAAGSTIAGNLLILGAASNVIIVQNAEKRGETLTFMEFARVGIPLTLVNILVYAMFL